MMNLNLPSNFFTGLVFYFHGYDPCLLESEFELHAVYEPIVPGSPRETSPDHPSESPANRMSILSIIQSHSGILLDYFDPIKTTHCICPCMDDGIQGDSITLATLYWLHDAIVSNDAHLPLSHSPLYEPRKTKNAKIAGLTGQIMSISGYHHHRQRSMLIAMLLQSGAMYTDYLSEKHNGLICESPTSQKYKKAMSCNMPIVNSTWLTDSYMACKAMDQNEAKYQVMPISMSNGMVDEKKSQPEKENDETCNQLARVSKRKRTGSKKNMEPLNEHVSDHQVPSAEPTPEPSMTKSTLAIKNTKGFKKSESTAKNQPLAGNKLNSGSNEPVPKIIENIEKTQVESTSRWIKNKQKPHSIDASESVMTIVSASLPPSTATADPLQITFSDTDASPTPQGMAKSPVTICLTGFRLSDRELKNLEELGAQQSDNIEKCTHLIAPKIQRTEKFLKAIPLGLAILSPEWISDVLTTKSFPLDENQYLLSDTAMEAKYHFTLKDSLERARKSKLFKDRQFYVAESTMPPRSVLATMISAAGGYVMPTTSPMKRLKTMLNDIAESSATLTILIDDAKGSLGKALPLAWSKPGSKVRIASVEYVLTGILTQAIQE